MTIMTFVAIEFYGQGSLS